MSDLANTELEQSAAGIFTKRLRELSTPGQKLAWSIAHYLDALEESVGDLIVDKAPPAPVHP